jgi:ABC-type glycerol-3-phosphate transport system substrate-binding protein
VGDAKTWLSKDAIIDLSGYLYANNGEWINTFREGVAEMIKYGDGKIYNIPYYIDSTPHCYHKEIFTKDNVQPAKTKKEFYALCEKFKSEGYIPFQLHGSMGDDFLAALSLQFAAKYGIKPFDIVEGKVPFTDPWFKDALAVYKEMYVKGYLPKNFWTIGGTDGRMAYSQGKMVMKHGFFWDVDTHKDMGMPYDNQGVASLPNFTDKEGINLYKQVAVFAFMVSSKCRNPETAVNFLKFLTNEENQDDMAYKYFGRYPNGMPVVNKNVELSEYALKYIVDLAKGNGTVYVPTNVSLNMGKHLHLNFHCSWKIKSHWMNWRLNLTSLGANRPNT